MSALKSLRWLPVSLLVVWLWSCGAGTEGGIDPTGGSLCLPDRTVCLVVPSGSLADYEHFRISSASDVPPAALSPGYDISPTTSTRVTFLKPARVVFKLEIVDQNAVPNENLLRLYTLDEDGTWQPLANSFVDRVRSELSGEVSFLIPGSSFVVLRTDRLPDGGLPIEGDSGIRDSGTPIIPDAGRPDAGRPDAGPPDAGRPDAGQPDAGRPDAGVDAGFDAGVDAGFDAGIDAGFDAGVDAGFDAGVDAGFDAGVDAGFDAGVDAGEPDAGDMDAGDVDAGDDAGVDSGM